MSSRNPPLRVAMAGAGFASALHLAGWKRVRDAQVVAICDPGDGKAAARAREFDVPEVFRDAERMLDRVQPDALDIVASLPAHAPLCLAAAARGIDILCQKPLASSVDEARALAAAVEGRSRLMVHENWRFRAHYRQIKRWLDATRIGTPVSATMEVKSSGLLEDERGVRAALARQPFMANLERFLIAEVLIHHLDVLRWLLGPLRVVSARTGRSCPVVKGEDHAVILLEGRDLRAILDASFVVPGAPPLPKDRLEITGTTGTVLLEASTLRLNGAKPETIELDLASGYPDSYAAAIAHFAAALASGAPFETGVPDNLQTLALVDEAYALASAGSAPGRA